MEHFKDRSKWGLVLAAIFVVTIAATALCFANWMSRPFTPDRKIVFLMSSGLGISLLTGLLAIIVVWRSRKEVMIYREKEREHLALNPSLITVMPKVHKHSPIAGSQPASPNGDTRLTTVYAEDHTIRYVSPAAESMLGYKQIEMIGESDLSNIHPDHLPAFSHMFTRLLENPGESIKLQYAYKTREGNYIWLESVASNGLADPSVNGYLLQTSDVTARRLEEQASRMRTKIQALSENSPDLIIRLEGDMITYINPVIEYYTGKPPVAFLNKRTRDTGLDESILDAWSKIVAQVSESGAKMILEISFPLGESNRIMQVHAIPEFDDEGKLESVLMVSHDITERKRIEGEVHQQHRKITESINYAKRIQGAILPNPRLISGALPDSFVLYKPRDLVSGDFPWFAQVKNDIFMAAVDCTGHGVPGALLSLIGYFLLNDIVRSRRITDPGRILDLLDEGVSATLRPDEDAGTKDGMDISLCRINVEDREVVFAGAHRPLYVIRDGDLAEIKGNKFPIGGGIFKNQTNFTSTRLQLGAGDSIFFCSDGFCDQFGGPKGRKFGTRQLREIMKKVNTIPMREAKGIFEDAWETWKGGQRQTDDVLLIGIRF